MKVLLAIAGVGILAALMVLVLPNLAPSKATEKLTEAQLIDDDFVLGRAGAPVLIVEFGDFLCEYCAKLSADVMPVLRKQYIDTGKAKMVFRDFISPSHATAVPASAAAHCTKQKFWDMHDILYQNSYTGDRWSTLENPVSTFAAYADRLGTNISSCMATPQILNEINDDIMKGLALNVLGTPTIMIGNDKKGFVRVLSAQPTTVYTNIIEEMLR
ncbi:thioredoxin domain-containing protein [Candidatus Woesearchaeota archaeon]|nr:thioredoxin domain-containing protein [Candidatus Woesearchaeota archaeon]